MISGKDDPDVILAELNEKNQEMGEMLKKQKEQTVTRYQDEFFAKNQQKQMEKVLQEIADIKSEMKEIKSLKKTILKNWNFVVLAVKWSMIKSNVLHVGPNKEESMKKK